MEHDLAITGRTFLPIDPGRLVPPDLSCFFGSELRQRPLDRTRLDFRKKATSAPPVRELTFTKRPEVDLKKVHEVNRAEVNRILDKISAHGMSALTSQERLFLSNVAPPDDRVPPVS